MSEVQTESRNPLLAQPSSESALFLTEMEQALLGGIMRDNRLYDSLAERLSAEDFYLPAHKAIFQEIARTILRGREVNFLTLSLALAEEESVQAQGGRDYLSQLENSLLPNVPREYVRTLRDLRLRRALVSLGESTAMRARSTGEGDAMQLIEETEQQLFDLATGGLQERPIQDLHTAAENAKNIADRARQRKREIVGVSTGLKELDLILGGLHDSDLLILAGRPSMGKTALGLTIAFNAAKLAAKDKDEPGRTLLFSLEMASEQLATRLLSASAGVSNDKIRRGQLHQSEFNKIVDATERMADIPLFIDDSAAISASAIRQRARRLKRKQRIDLIVIDYLQLMQPAPGERVENRVQEISNITRALKALAKDLNVPVLALSQLSREVEKRDPPRPQLSDLRESGAIEQDADVVMFIYREVYYHTQRKQPQLREGEHEQSPSFQARQAQYNKRLEELTPQAQVIIAKHRNGPISVVDLHFNAALTTFTDAAKKREKQIVADTTQDSEVHSGF